MQETNWMAKMNEDETQKHSPRNRTYSNTEEYMSDYQVDTREGGFLPHTSNTTSAILRNIFLLKLCFQLHSATDPLSFLLLMTLFNRKTI